jgi:hypothetical protein
VCCSCNSAWSKGRKRRGCGVHFRMMASPTKAANIGAFGWPTLKWHRVRDEPHQSARFALRGLACAGPMSA